MLRNVRVATPEGLRQELARFELAHDMSSGDFLQRWGAGQLDERMDYFRWAGVCHLAIKMGILTPTMGQDAVS